MADQDSNFTSKEVGYMANMLLSLKGGELKVERNAFTSKDI